jgi:hypothetical protein
MQGELTRRVLRTLGGMAGLPWVVEHEHDHAHAHVHVHEYVDEDVNEYEHVDGDEEVLSFWKFDLGCCQVG